MSELKHCPFCGHKANRDIKSIRSGMKYRVICYIWSGMKYRVICYICRCSTGWYPTQGLADKAWNKRV